MSNEAKELVFGVVFYAFILIGIGGIVWEINEAHLSEKAMSGLQVLLIVSGTFLAMHAAFDVEVVIEKETQEFKVTSFNKTSSKIELFIVVILAIIFAATKYII